jgi:glycosyltransferase involved in cell wall biosynthesis
MNVLYLGLSFRLDTTTDKIGGGEISNRMLLQNLAKKHAVYVFSAYGSNMWGHEYNGVKVYDLSSKLKWLGPLSTIFSKVLFRFFYCFYAINVKPDIILCGPNSIALSLLLSKKFKIKAGCFIRAFENFTTENESFSKKVKVFFKTIVYGGFKKKSVNKLDFLLPNSDFMLSECKKEFDCKVCHIVYPPINIISHDFSTPKKLKNIVMVSNQEHKGFGIFKSLSEKFLDLKFTAVGVSGVTSIKKISENLYFEGWQKTPKDFILKADLILVPSVWEEPFGRIAIEALYCGRMVIVSDKGGLPEAVNYCSELILPIDDIELWISRLNLIKNTPSVYEKEYKSAILNAERFRAENQTEYFELFLEACTK